RNADRGKRKALFLIDIERFKNINDSLGQAAGDALLVQFADWLTDYVVDASKLARIGADHFAVIMPERGRDGSVAMMIERILGSLKARSFAVNDTELRISSRIGIALFPDDGTDAETLFNHAEAALKMTKRSGVPYLLHTKSMTESVAATLSLENKLRKAIDNEEFVLYYQPKVHQASGKVLAAEALIRWQEPNAGIVPPVQFISVLEETGMIYEVGRWALAKAITEGLRWIDVGYPALRIAVNVSPMQLKNPGFVEEIKHKIGVAPQASSILQLELTESTVMEDIVRSIGILQSIREMGVTIAIDDFGTGYSSLSQLGKLPLDELKIDRSFVIKMVGGPKDLALVSTIISLAHSLNLRVVAEGVETDEQARLLSLLACDEIQGYFYGKPVPTETFEEK
ncbi:MAG: bifunctional diguanylate cyclase/phosphodiesterase, partial [Burkholderiales bacterium 21-58-4]